MKKIIIFDKDHTLVVPKSGKTFVQSPTDQIPNIDPRRISELAKTHSLFIASNQGGVAAKHKTMASAIDEMQYCLSLFPELKYALFCPDYDGKRCFKITKNDCEAAIYWYIDDDDCWQQNLIYGCLDPDLVVGKCRKPNGGMLEIIKHESQCDHALMVGDRQEDSDAAEAAGIAFTHIYDFLNYS